MKALVIGIGNPLRGDDGVGVRLVEELAEAWGAWSAPEVELRAVHQLTPELALDLTRAGRVLFVDAWRPESGSGVSDLAQPWIEPLSAPGQAEADSGLGGHVLAPAALVAVARALYGWRGEAALLRVPAQAFGHGSAFSALLRGTLPLARRLLGEWLVG